MGQPFALAYKYPHELLVRPPPSTDFNARPPHPLLLQEQEQKPTYLAEHRNRNSSSLPASQSALSRTAHLQLLPRDLLQSDSNPPQLPSIHLLPQGSKARSILLCSTAPSSSRQPRSLDFHQHTSDWTSHILLPASATDQAPHRYRPCVRPPLRPTAIANRHRQHGRASIAFFTALLRSAIQDASATRHLFRRCVHSSTTHPLPLVR